MVSNKAVPNRAHMMGTVPKKNFGQHFLTSTHYAQKIADAIKADSKACVVEIGAGQGALSRLLIKRFPHLHMIEMDRDVIGRLTNNLAQGSWTIHEGNVLDMDFGRFGTSIHFIGNLPYNIGALIIKKVLLCGQQVASCTFMVQREVAERIAADPGSKRNGFLSIFCQFFGKPRILFHVPPGAFFPKPKVESSVFQIEIESNLEKKLKRDKWERFFSFVDKGFLSRRKMLVNNLGTQNKCAVAGYLEKAGLSAKSRPEQLGAHEWLALYKSELVK